MTLKTSNHHRILLGLSLKGLIAVVLFSIVLVLTIFSLIFNWRSSSVAFTPVKTDSDASDSCDSEVNTNSKAIFVIENNTVCTPFSKSLKAIVVPAFASRQSSPTYIQPVFERNFGEVKRIPGNENISEFEKIACKGVCESTPPATTPPASTSCKGVCQSTPPASTPPATTPPATTPPATTPPATTPPASTSCKGRTVATTPPTTPTTTPTTTTTATTTTQPSSSCKGCTVATTPPTTTAPTTTAPITLTQSQIAARAEAAQRATEECLASGGIPRTFNHGIACDNSNDRQANCESYSTHVWRNGRCVSVAEGACINYGSGWRWTGSQCLGPPANQGSTATIPYVPPTPTTVPPLTQAQQCRKSYGSWNGSRCISPAELQCREAIALRLLDAVWNGTECRLIAAQNCENMGRVYVSGSCLSQADADCRTMGAGYRLTGSQCLGPSVNQDTVTTTAPTTTTQSQSDAIAEAAQLATEECAATGGIPRTVNNRIACDPRNPNAAPVKPLGAVEVKFDTEVKCWRYSTSVDVDEALNLAQGYPQLATCIPPGMLEASRDYSAPSWGYDKYIYHEYGWLLVREGGDTCSNYPDSGLSFDFTIACKAHDYCWDLIRAGVSYPVSESTCNKAFLKILVTHCSNRGFVSRHNNPVKCLGYSIPIVGFFEASNHGLWTPAGVTQNPSKVRLTTKESPNKCLDIELATISFSTGIPFQVWECRDGSYQAQDFKLKAVNKSRSYRGNESQYGKFLIEVKKWGGKCLSMELESNRVVATKCKVSEPLQQFKIVATPVSRNAPGDDQYFLQDANNPNNCIGVTGYNDGEDLIVRDCSITEEKNIWKIKPNA